MLDDSIDKRILGEYCEGMYRAAERKKVEGWFSEIDARVFELLLGYQTSNEIHGSVAEIGLHHGKSFILLCTSLQKNEKAYGIDVFDSQDLNLDSSGFGNKNLLIKNLIKYKCEMPNIVLDSRESQKVQSTDVTNAVNRVRFFSIDGGHWYSTVLCDLDLAKECLATGGIIALDDYLRPDWPEVARAFHKWYESNSDFFSIVAIGFNKVYLAHSDWASRYRVILEEDRKMRFLLNKYYKINDIQIPVYSVFSLPEMPLKTRVINYLKLYHLPVYFFYMSSRRLYASFRRNSKKEMSLE